MRAPSSCGPGSRTPRPSSRNFRHPGRRAVSRRGDPGPSGRRAEGPVSQARLNRRPSDEFSAGSRIDLQRRCRSSGMTDEGMRCLYSLSPCRVADGERESTRPSLARPLLLRSRKPYAAEAADGYPGSRPCCQRTTRDSGPGGCGSAVRVRRDPGSPRGGASVKSTAGAVSCAQSMASFGRFLRWVPDRSPAPLSIVRDDGRGDDEWGKRGRRSDRQSRGSPISMDRICRPERQEALGSVPKSKIESAAHALVLRI